MSVFTVAVLDPATGKLPPGVIPSGIPGTPTDWSQITSKPTIIAAGPDVVTARNVIGAGTSNFDGTWTSLSGKPTTFPPTIGTTSTTAKAGNWFPASSDVTDASVVGRQLITAVDGPTARSVIGAGTSNFNGAYSSLSGIPATFAPIIGTTSTTAKAGNWAPGSTDITDSTAIGRSLITAADAPTARTAIGAGTSSFNGAWSSLTGVPSVFPTNSTNISDATTVGKSVLTAVDAPTARAAIGAGTSSFSGAYASLTGIPATFATTSALISDATTVGKAVLVATDAPTARSAIGAGTSSFSGAYSALSGIPSTFATTSTQIGDASTLGKGVLTATNLNGVNSAIGVSLVCAVLEVSGAYPNRPATTAPVMWIGKDAPATGGTTAGGTAAAVDGLDVWLQTVA